jgi:hypothetical protein
MLGLGWLAQADAALLSKAYNFKDDVTLEVGESTADGLRLDSVRFRLPRTIDGEHTRTGGVVKAEVALSNTTAVGLKAGIAIALFDEGNRLVGVASGGSRLVSVKANRQKLYTLVFDNVNAEAHRAATFQISVESKP